ncbi:type I-F CRISPR-associated protein Csy1 [Pasteurella canis]|uniref:type I-F CRISPR-associated protein Csy1 n=1 Tax=Pasteurella canis TaxID=753 RepID=UPI001CC754B8|nr:type I-F CRISPR-associated protein Csy1 [Pasteurella canis]UAY77143.1 type I-F CRISPR-associated protein Csy1 [Pasteurella canis]
MSNNIKSRIASFPQEQKIKKSEKERKKLEKAINPVEIEKSLKLIQKFDEKYQFDTWIANLANRMAKSLKFGTHISKGIHPDSRGNNVKFQPNLQGLVEYVGSHNIKELELDANGDASALPLAAFFNFIVDEENQLTLRELLLADDTRLDGCFSDDLALSEQHKKQFQQALVGDLSQLNTYELNKQLFWVNSNTAIRDDDYTCLIPLYPSSLTHAFYQKITQKRSSEQNKQARDNRYKKSIEQKNYLSINGLAIVFLGGSNSQNVSQLNSSQKGRHYLLPSLPPVFKSNKIMRLNLSSTTIFNDELAYICRAGLYKLYSVIEAKKNVYTIRDTRIEALNMILEAVLRTAIVLQKQPVGWSKEYQLNMNEKYWLDPKRAELADEEAFRTEREKGDWVAEVERSFALWLNECLKRRFPKLKHDFADAEYNEWRRNIHRSLRYRLRHS